MAVRRARADCPTAPDLLRALLSEVDGSTALIGHRAGGQPFLPDRPDLAVSLADDGDWLAAAVGVGRAVGVDVQLPRPVGAARLRRCGRPDTRTALAALPDTDRNREYARIWTVQEACVKAAGAGLGGRPWRIPVGFGEFNGRWGEYRWHDVPGFVVPVSVAHQVLCGEMCPATGT